MTVSSAVHSSSAIRPPRRHYAHAPVVETVVEIVAESKQGHNISQLKALGAKEPVYSEVRETHEFGAAVELKAGGKASSEGHQRLIGYQFVDSAGARIFSARVDRFSFSKLQPYTEWESVRDEALRLWHRYANAAKVKKVTRLGVRYINRLDLPGPLIELKEWLLTGPEVAAGMPQQVAAFAMQLMLPQPDLQGTMAAVRIAVVDPPNPKTVSVVLDIDVQRSGSDVGLSSLQNELDLLHDRENLIFECSITDRVREKIG